MTISTARNLINVPNAVVQCPALKLFGVIEKVTEDGFATILQPGGRRDDVQVSRLELDAT